MTTPDDPRNSQKRWGPALDVWLKVVNLAMAFVKLAKMLL